MNKKQKIKTVEKRRITANFIVCLIISALGFAALSVSIILKLKLDFGTVGTVLILSTALLFIISVSALPIIYKTRYKYCRFCGKSLKKSKCFYSLGGIEANETRAVQTVHFRAKCRRCSEKNEFDKKFTIIHTMLDGRWKSYDIDERTIEFIEKAFNLDV